MEEYLLIRMYIVGREVAIISDALINHKFLQLMAWNLSNGEETDRLKR